MTGDRSPVLDHPIALWRCPVESKDIYPKPVLRAGTKPGIEPRGAGRMSRQISLANCQLDSDPSLHIGSLVCANGKRHNQDGNKRRTVWKGSSRTSCSQTDRRQALVWSITAFARLCEATVDVPIAGRRSRIQPKPHEIGCRHRLQPDPGMVQSPLAPKAR
jgi:hypothetical protein